MPFDPSILSGGAGGSPPVDSALKGYTGPMPLADEGASETSSLDINKSQAIGGAGSAGMGLVQMAVGMSQLRKARRLPFPGFLATKGPYAQMKSIYEQNMKQGIGSEQRGIMRQEFATQNAKGLNAIQQSSPQASMAFGRAAAMDRTAGESKIAQADIAARQRGAAGIASMNRAMTNIEQKDIQAKRDFKIRAEQAAGQAIARGSENIAIGLDPSKSTRRTRSSYYE